MIILPTDPLCVVNSRQNKYFGEVLNFVVYLRQKDINESNWGEEAKFS